MRLESTRVLSRWGMGVQCLYFCFLSSPSSFHVFSACVLEALRFDVAPAFRVVLRLVSFTSYNWDRGLRVARRADRKGLESGLIFFFSRVFVYGG